MVRKSINPLTERDVQVQAAVFHFYFDFCNKMLCSTLNIVCVGHVTACLTPENSVLQTYTIVKITTIARTTGIGRRPRRGGGHAEGGPRLGGETGRPKGGQGDGVSADESTVQGATYTHAYIRQ